MDDAVEKLTARVSELAGAVESLEARVAVLERTGIAPEAPPAAAAEAAAVPPQAPSAGPAAVKGASPFESLSRTIAVAGRGVLALGGAFLIRALTEAGALPHGVGVTLGLAYALAWLFLSERGARRGDSLRAAADALTATVIVCPLVWEAATRLGVLSPFAAAGLLGTFAALGLALSAIRDLPAAGWFVLLGVLPVAFVLLVTTHALATFLALLLLVGSLSLGAASFRDWTGLPWPAALAADFAVVSAGFVATRPAGEAEEYAGVSPGVLAALAVLLAALYLAASLWRTALRRQSPSALDWIQTPAAITAGLGTAAWLGSRAGISEVAVGAGAGAAAAALYALANARKEVAPVARLHASLAFLLALALVGLAIPAGLRFASLAVFGLLAAAFAARGAGRTPAAHAAVYLLLAAATGRLLEASFSTFAAPAASSDAPIPGSAVLVFGAAAAAYALLTGSGAHRSTFWTRLPALTSAALTALGAGVIAEHALATFVGVGVSRDPGLVAAIRSSVLAGAALLLAAGKGRPRLLELSWLVWPLLALGGLKLVFEDLPNGRPATLFPAFALYGLALVYAPRLLRAASTSPPPP
jgi:drug/metabolite transporter superfamily protein YnfA